MGTMLEARCDCGFAREFFAGGGMTDFDTTCALPAACLPCQQFVVANYVGKEARCPECDEPLAFYDSPSLQGGLDEIVRREHSFFLPNSGREVRIPARGCVCPKCGEFGLCFMQTGCWD